MPTDAKEIFLTFDDGPVPGPTEFVLDTLRSFSAYATFFCIGDNVQKHPDVFLKIVGAGHSIGNHTFHHMNGWKFNTEPYLQNVVRCEEVMEDSGITRLHEKPLFRPPYGRITRSQINALNHYRIIMWDVLSIDYNKNLSAEVCLRNTVRATRNGSVVVFHDSVKAEKNMRFALPRFLDHFSTQGYSFKAIV